MPSHPLAISITPAVQHYHGHPVKVKVTNIGTLPVRVTERTVTLHARCQQVTTAAIAVHPASFKLAAGHSRVVKITVPSGASADYGVAFGAVVQGAGGGKAAGAVGEQVLTGRAASCVHPKVPVTLPDHQAASGIGLLNEGFIGVGVLLVLLGGLGALLWKRRKARRTPHMLP